MDDLETVITCPLGSECREIKDGKVYQCRWFKKLRGKDAAGDEHDEWDCAISWQPLLTTEVAKQVVGTNASIQSMRNEQVTGHQAFMRLAQDRSI